MRFSTVAATGAGALTAAVGIGCAFLCPLAGLAAGAYFTYGAAVTAGMTGIAGIALGAAGAAGGLIIGRIVAPVVAVASVGLGMAVGGTVKLFGSLFERLCSRGKTAEAAPQKLVTIDARSSFRSQMKLAAQFAGLKKSGPANEDAPPSPRAKRLPGFRL